MNHSDLGPQQKRHLSWRVFLSIAISVSLAGGISFWLADQQLTQLLTTKKHVSFYRPIRLLTDLGEGRYYFILVLGLGLTSWILSRTSKLKAKIPFAPWSQLNAWCGHALLCMISCGVILQTLKHIIGRQRPHVSADTNPHIFDFFTGQWHYHSFPSGHSQTLFTFTTLLWVAFPRLTAWVFLVPAALALTRLPLEEHFLSDIIFGSYLGFAVTVLISFRRQKMELDSLS